MKSVNFEFLRPRRAALADLGGFAERYAHEDPASSLIKQRSFVEHAVAAIYEGYGLRPPYSDNLNDLMNDTAFRQAVPEVVQNKLHAVRKAGNHAAHPRRPITSQLSLECLAEVFDIARWFFVQLDGGQLEATPKYTPPLPEPASAAKTKDALEKLRLAEARYESVLKDLDEETKKRLDAERAATEATRTAEERESELTRLRDAGQKVASALAFNEATTRRRLIDQALLAAGWNVGVDGESNEQVKQELKLTGLPTPSGDGFADYVLYGDDGKPLAVVEAKKTAKDARAGGEQARQYADALEKATGVRPVVFFTNGIDVFLWDDAPYATGGRYPYRKVYGFYSKDSLEYLVHQRTGKKALADVAPNLDIAGRMYQLEAVKRVCERFEGNFRKALVVQATGTGKTRVAISLCDVLFSRKDTHEHVGACVFVAKARSGLLLPDLIFRPVLSEASGLRPETLWARLGNEWMRKHVQALAGGHGGLHSQHLEGAAQGGQPTGAAASSAGRVRGSVEGQRIRSHGSGRRSRGGRDPFRLHRGSRVLGRAGGLAVRGSGGSVAKHRDSSTRDSQAS